MIATSTSSREDRGVNVLVAEEDDVARVFLAENLTADGYEVRTADSREQALARLSVQQPDVIVVDVNGKTLELIDAIRTGDGLAGHVDPATPLMVLTARADELHRIRVLDRGGDDVLAKPYSYPELRARLAALLRRARASHAPRLLRVGELKIDLAARTVDMRGNRVELPAKEYARSLANRPECSPARSYCGTSGATCTAGGPARSTVMLSPARFLALAVWVAGSVRPVGDALSQAVWIAPSPRS